MSLAAALLLLAAGAIAGSLGGLFGIGGGVVVVPALYAVFTALDVPEAARIKLAVGTSLATIVVTSVRSLRAHDRTGRVDRALLRAWAPFIACGALVGSGIARILPADGLTALFAFGVLIIGVQRLLAGGRTRRDAALPSVSVQRGLALGTGTLSSLMGIGGGVFGVLLLTRFGRTTHQAVATAAGFGLAIALPGALGFALLGSGEGPWGTVGAVNMPAFAIVAAASASTAPFGARLAHALPSTALSRAFAAYLLVTGVLLILETV